MKIDGSTIIGEIVKVNYKAAKVFDAYNIDFCCGGGVSLKEACEKSNTNLNDIIPKLEAYVLVNDADSKYIDSLALNELCDYIERRHHTYVNENLPFIQQKLQKLCDVHGEHHKELFEIKALFDGAAVNLSEHMKNEETILFPYVRAMINYKKGNIKPSIELGNVLEPINQMEEEHKIEGERFGKISSLTNNFTCPADGCTTYQVTFNMLKDFEQDLHRHIHLESNILFRKAVVFEKELLS